MRAHLRGRGAALLVATAAAAVVAAGCSSSSDGGTTGPITSTAGASSSGSKAAGSPIKVGFVNSDQGGFAVPEISKVAQAAADWLNDHGGVTGHVLELDMCSTDGTPAASTRCANQFITDKVLAVLNGNDLGIDSAVPVYKKALLHLFGAVGGPAVLADPNNTIMMPPAATVFAAAGSIYKLAGIHNGVVILPNAGPQVKELFDGARAAAATAGVELSLSLVAPANPDITAAVTAAKAKHADGIILSFSENDCTNAVRTAKSLDWDGVIFASSCSQFIKELGAQAAGVFTTQYLFPYNSRVTAEKYDPQLRSDFKKYEDVVKKSGLEQYLDSAYAEYGFSTVMTFANILKGIDGDITQESINEALSTFKGHEVLGTAQDCTAKLQPGGGCGRYNMVFQVQADGTQTLVGGKPLDLSTLAGRK